MYVLYRVTRYGIFVGLENRQHLGYRGSCSSSISLCSAYRVTKTNVCDTAGKRTAKPAHSCVRHCLTTRLTINVSLLDKYDEF